MGRPPAGPSWQAVETEGIAGVTVAAICLPWSCCLFLSCNSPKWSERAQLPGTKQDESLILFCTLLLTKVEVTVMADEPLSTACVLFVHELPGTAAVHEALA